MDDLSKRINGKVLDLKQVTGGYNLVNSTNKSHSYCFIPEDDLHYVKADLVAFPHDDYVYRLKLVQNNHWALYNVTSQWAD